MVHADAASRGSDAAAAAAGPAADIADQRAQAAEKLATEEGDGDDSNEACGFCRFMKGGGCRAAFMVRVRVFCLRACLGWRLLPCTRVPSLTFFP